MTIGEMKNTLKNRRKGDKGSIWLDKDVMHRVAMMHNIYLDFKAKVYTEIIKPNLRDDMDIDDPDALKEMKELFQNEVYGDKFVVVGLRFTQKCGGLYLIVLYHSIDSNKVHYESWAI